MCATTGSLVSGKDGKAHSPFFPYRYNSQSTGTSSSPSLKLVFPPRFLSHKLAMGALKTAEWRKLPLSLTELCIDTTLRCGQSFRWRKLNDEWSVHTHCPSRFGRHRLTWSTGTALTMAGLCP